jgi:hypothetical protein
MGTTFNVYVFPEVSSNPVSESGEPLFLEENLKVFPTPLPSSTPSTPVLFISELLLSL